MGERKRERETVVAFPGIVWERERERERERLLLHSQV